MLSDLERRVINFTEQYFLAYGLMPDDKILDEVFSISKTNLLKSTNFRDALNKRGIVIRGNPSESESESELEEALVQTLALKGAVSNTPAVGALPVSSGGNGILTEQQLFLANTLLDYNDTRSRTKKIKECGVSTLVYTAWLRDPVFQGYLRQRSEGMLHDRMHEVHSGVLSRAAQGDVPAAKLVYELTGRHIAYENRKSDSVDVSLILLKVIETLQRLLVDQPEIIEAVADELAELIDKPELTAPSLTAVGAL